MNFDRVSTFWGLLTYQVTSGVLLLRGDASSALGGVNGTVASEGLGVLGGTGASAAVANHGSGFPVRHFGRIDMSWFKAGVWLVRG